MDVTAVLVVALCGAILALLRLRRLKAEDHLRSLFDAGEGFVGKDITYITSKAGPSAFFGSMDHGRDVAQWKTDQLLVEVWFQGGVCTEIEVRSRR